MPRADAQPCSFLNIILTICGYIPGHAHKYAPYLFSFSALSADLAPLQLRRLSVRETNARNLSL
ncbi:MAG: YqaE/Pmp3 family membrane protein [Microbacterium hominis]|nr:YqaE/Pmp3 family membrane protein [Microbacterium hominis]